MKRLILVLALLAPMACTTRTVPANPSTSSAGSTVAAQLAVEGFLNAVNARDLSRMSQIFGSKDGTLMDQGVAYTDVELRMDLLVNLLRHRSYEVLNEQRVAGREGNVRRVGVNLTMENGRRVPDVGFVVLEGRGGRWYIEEIDTRKVAGTGD